ncbi:solute carrier family 13 member 4-like isoform X2 [Rhinatrema bivittatum]|uniref:solute carrier family 13 member 4-like isoform X2 n=1 Tax=Rhinatrema bivittatum TaxID=194408 RepID=UPI00112D0AFA|nr:solute carrier family 13 member 4-like isoform X2 [Rhinatrema bivittatum]
MANSLFQHLWQQKDAVIIFLFPLLLLPFPLLVQTQEAACAYILLVTAAYWISEAIPLGAAAMVPAFLFPLFGIMKSSEVAAEYLKDIHLLLFGVVCLAASIQKWNLHRRIALWMVLSVGGHPSWLLLGFMSCTALLSMWLSNTSTAAMVMPIVDAVLCQLSGAKPEERALSELAAKDLDASKIDLPISPESNILDYCTDNNQVCSSAFSWTLKECPPEKIFSLQEEQTFQTQRPSKQGKRLYRTEQDHMTCKAFSLGIAYSSTVGGMTTLTGTSTNLIFLEQFETRYPDCQIINFGTWIAFSFPIALIILLLSWMWINWLFLGFSFKDMCCYKKGSKSETDSRKILKQEYSKLGPLSYPEVVTLVVFLLMALSWFTRDPGFIPGWDSLFGPKGYKSDATSAVLFGFLLFIIPGKKPKAFSFRSSGLWIVSMGGEKDGSSKQLARVDNCVACLSNGNYCNRSSKQSSNHHHISANPLLPCRSDWNKSPSDHHSSNNKCLVCLSLTGCKPSKCNRLYVWAPHDAGHDKDWTWS